MKRIHRHISPPFVASPTLLLWYRGDHVISDVHGVSQWTDLSGNGNHAVQATNANKPTLTAADSELGGMPAVAFTTGQHLNCQFSVVHSPPTTIYIVMYCADLAIDNRVLDGGGTQRAMLDIAQTTGDIQLYAGAPFLDSGHNITAGVGTLLTTVYNGSSSAIYQDGISIASGASGSVGGIDLFRIGWDGGAASFHGAVAEIKAYATGAPSATDIAAWHHYSQQRYGTP